MTENTYVSVTQLARRYSVDRSTIWRWVQRGTLPEPVQLSEQCVRWRNGEVEAFERERKAIKETPQTKRAELAGAASTRKRAEKKAKHEAAA